MLITALEKERKELRKQMRRDLETEMKHELEKKIEGELGKQLYEKGKLEEQIETAKKMLLRGFDATVIAELTGLPEDEILKLKTAITNS